MFDALQTAAAADRIALQFPDRSLTYGELDRLSAALAAALTGARCVAIVAENRIETCVAVVAALRAAVPAVPLNPRSGTAELAHIVSDAAPDAVLSGPGTKPPPALGATRQITVELDHDRPAPRTTPPAPAPDEPALIVYTSGTTGPPKGAVMPRRAITTNLDALAEIWEWTERDVVAHALPLFHVHGLVVGILGPLRRGGRALHLGRFEPAAVGAALSADATVLFGVPTMYRRLADAAEDDPGLAAALGRARLLVSGSAALPAAEHARLTRLTGRPVLERYGMSETLMNTGIRVGARAAPGTVGPPLPGVGLRLVDDDGNVLQGDDDETIGEVQVRGPNLFLGYLNLPDATAAAFTEDGWFITGDMATRGADGYIRLVGRRATDLIKSGGYKIGAGEIEAALREHPAVADAAVTGEPDDDLGERVIAWVVLTDRWPAPPPPDRDRLAAELVEHVAAQLAPHKRPRTDPFPRRTAPQRPRKGPEAAADAPKPSDNASLGPRTTGKALPGRRREGESEMSIRLRITSVALVLTAATGVGTAQAARVPGNSGSFTLTARSTTAASGYAPTFTGNGLLGVRVPAAGQGYAAGTVPAQSELAGFYAKPSTGKASARVQQRANIPTWSTLTFADGGHTFSPRAGKGKGKGNKGKVSDYRQSLDLRTGIVTTHGRWTAPNGHVTTITYQVLASRALEQVGLVRLTLRPHWSGTAAVTDEIDGTADTKVASGTPVLTRQVAKSWDPATARGRRHRCRGRNRDPSEHCQPAGPERQHHHAQHRGRPGQVPERRPADPLPRDRRPHVHPDQVRRRLEHGTDPRRCPSGSGVRGRHAVVAAAAAERERVGQPVARPDRCRRRPDGRHRRQRVGVLSVVEHPRRPGLEHLTGRPLLERL